jgi:hypothetical protein
MAMCIFICVCLEKIVCVHRIDIVRCVMSSGLHFKSFGTAPEPCLQRIKCICGQDLGTPNLLLVKESIWRVVLKRKFAT